MSKTYVKLGTKVRDAVSGVEGIATARTTYWPTGRVRVMIEGPAREGKPSEIWFDEDRLQLSEPPNVELISIIRTNDAESGTTGMA